MIYKHVTYFIYIYIFTENKNIFIYIKIKKILTKLKKIKRNKI